MQFPYEACCLNHKERCTVFRTVGVDSYIVMPYEEPEASDFLKRHYGCELTLIWRDDQLDKMNDLRIYSKNSPFRKEPIFYGLKFTSNHPEGEPKTKENYDEGNRKIQ